MGTDRRIFREVDGLSGLITLSLSFGRSLPEGRHFLLLPLELLLLLFNLGLEILDLLAEFADFRGLRLPTPEQNRGDNVDWGLEFSDLFVP